jgi:hypothetical protein
LRISQVFGGAACLSTHWTGTFTNENNPFPESALRYLDKNLPDPKTHKIYLTAEIVTLDALYPEIQKKQMQLSENTVILKRTGKRYTFPVKITARKHGQKDFRSL